MQPKEWKDPMTLENDASAPKTKDAKKLSTTYVIVAVFVLAVVVWGGLEFLHMQREAAEQAKRKAYLAQPRNMETDVLEEGFTNVSVDVVSFDPWYEVYRSNNTLNSTGYVCRCKTVHNNTVWVYAPKYGLRVGYLFSRNNAETLLYPAEDPLKLNGSLVKITDIADDPHTSIGKDEWILKVSEYPVAYSERPERQAYLQQPRNVDTDELEEGFKNVSADIVSIEPWISLSDRQFSFMISDVIFKCRTVQGKTFYAYIHAGGATEAYIREHYPARQYPSSLPHRIQGSLVSAKSLSSSLAISLGPNTLLLTLEHYPEEASDDGVSL